MTTHRAPLPRIAVIVPAYGVAHLVGAALDSLQQQDFTDWEAVVIDDGAPDDVRGAVAPYLADSRIRFIASDNEGVSGARNRAIAATTAPYIALLDGDDLFRPTYLSTMVAALDENPDVSIVTCNARTFGAIPQEGEVVAPGQNIESLGRLEQVLDRRFNIYIGSSFRRAQFDAIGGYDVAMTHAEDLDLWVRLLMHFGPALYIDKILGDYRIRSRSASTNYLKLLRGQIRIYDKVDAGAVDAGTRATVKMLRDVTVRQERLEAAVARVIAGDTKVGLRVLRNHKDAFDSRAWGLAFILWKLVPALAPPMLSWRKRRHATTHARATILPPSDGAQG